MKIDSNTKQATLLAKQPDTKRIPFGICIIVGIFLIGGGVTTARITTHLPSLTILPSGAVPSAQIRAAFPEVDKKRLSPIQTRILSIARAEYAKNPVNYDASVMAYTQGNREAWCADFISWVMRQAGAPYANPNSGSWRIPGVYTLQEYYQGKGRYEPVGRYAPQIGDVAIYNSDQAKDSSGNVHAALVLSAQDGQLTTIGGNEGGKMALDTRPLQYGNDGLVGFGRL